MMRTDTTDAPTTPPVRSTQLRRHGGIALLVTCAAMALASCGSSSSPTTTPSAHPKPTPAATPTPVPANTLVSNMINEMGYARSMRIQFNGSDQGGSLQFDLQTDGQGNLSGTYVREGKTAQIVIYQNFIYMNGGDAIASFTGLGATPAATGWYQLPPPVSGELLDTLANPALLRACLSTITAGGYVEQASGTVDGTAVRKLAPSGSNGWQFVVQAHGVPNLLGLQLVSGGNNEPACNGGVIDRGPRSGTTGVFSFSNFDVPVSIKPPASFAPLPNPDPGTGIQ
jgi:hypothetical protein